LLGIGGGGTAVLFRYGVVTLFGVEGESVPEFLRSIESFVSEPFAVPEQEETQLAIRAGIDQPTVDSTGTIVLLDNAIERLQLTADMLAKNLILAHYEGCIRRL
jgi:uncharacterized Rmd1/YagE family protein